MTRALASRAALLAPVLFALAVPAHAEDTRLVAHAYSDNEVVRIDGKAGIQAAIEFGDGESIENVAVGDSQAWQITPNKRADMLFVKPLEATARTNMTVVTNRHTYFFDLVASPKAKPLYMLRFTYKDEPREAPVPGAAMAGLNPAEQALATGDPMGMPADPASLNFAWKRSGSDKLLPARIYDDGNSTYLVWPEKSSVPAILVENEKGEEGPVNYAVHDSTIVLPDVPGKIILRSGKASAVLENTRPVSAAPGAAMAANTSASSTAKGN
ncbi:TrbG/VirB9 family P-type conjugative transfer protein [Novosphingobium album (ex Hu et al. 2023)]|uniref:TrbG/VirB9 family P-type conjugative transfer protein n=1 Tax=Novosphingobium album (ex Hu et al. 2023) TaxID=2930093 RepID=A0ABT0B2C4_9SPHN|nr:TrbG/VirB9 family P-type conjugative transfer protein [Novosphingobium album (ex Hu et al. 2023)]MCJ2179211.1 TrbG/VirB9 family P-type conjugative transfer protein [Novosphingobium album (ex Hu et al. 2023)]